MINMNWVAWPLKNFKITALLVGLLTLFGAYSMYVMPKDEFPPYVIRQGVVIAVNPGATSEEIEAQVARPLERYLFTFREVNREHTTTTSMNGMCLAMVVLNDDVMNKDEVWSKMKHGINNFKSQLPSSTVALIVNDDFGDTSALLVSIESEQRSYRELQQYSDDLADRLRRIESVSNVRQYGNIKEQITLYVDRERLAAYGIGQSQLAQVLNSQTMTTMAGQVSTTQNNLTIHIAPTQNSEQEIAEQIIYTDPAGKVVRVRDVARVVREYDTSESYIEQNGHRCVLLSLEMQSGNNIVQYGKDVDRVLNEFRTGYLPKDVQMERITDLPQVVGKSVTDFLINLVESMLVILLVMLVLFPWRSAVVAAAVVPISTFVSVGLMYLVDMPLNLMSLACLIVVLGMIVDNSIVVLDGYLEYLGKGYERHDAAIESVKQYFMPMLLATICICAIFFPIVSTLKGAPGDVVQIFPLCITINLMVSLFLAVCVMPALEVRLIKKAVSGRKAKGKKNITDYVQSLYDKVLRWNFRHPWLTIIGALILVAIGGAIFPHLKMRQFPYADRNQFAVEIYLPQGSGIDETRAVANEVRDLMQKDERITTVTSFVGCASPRFHVAYAPQMGGPNYAQLIVNTPDIATTAAVLDDYSDRYANHWPNAYVKFKQIDYLDVPTYEYRFVGENLDSLHAAADRLMAEMRTYPELLNIRTDFDQPHPIIDIELDPVASAQLGVNRTTAALQLAAQTGSLNVGSLWEDNYELPIVLRSEPSKQVENADDVKNVYIGYKATPVRQVAEVVPQWTETNIVHRSGERCISVTADGKRGVLALPVQNRIIDYVKNMPLPNGVRAEVGGETERNNDMLPQIAAGIALSLVIIFFFILFSFKRFDITFLSIAAMGLGVPGAMIGLLVADRVLGLTSLFGFVTLMGIIMRNEILIFEHADAKMAEGLSAREAAFDAGRRRMVPIFLTTATTAVGVIPMIIDESSFWTPVGITIFAGGIGTLILVVTVLPVVYWKMYAKKNDKMKNDRVIE
ncbi:MAG: efflux RND transporter permease subunit [Bacteroidales bacterium]|nr:efflux RND transporter permease subunit [Bacteroidales bacterium]